MLSQAQRAAILELHEQRVSKREIARVLRVSRLTVRKVLQSKSVSVPEMQRPEKAEPYRRQILETADCPFANLPEAKSGRWGQGLTAAKMKDCRWLKPTLVGQFEFVEWTDVNHLRHTRFIALRDDKAASQVKRES